jgi:hypothetical protein
MLAEYCFLCRAEVTDITQEAKEHCAKTMQKLEKSQDPVQRTIVGLTPR